MSTIDYSTSYCVEGIAGIGPLSQVDDTAICTLGRRLNFKTAQGEVEAIYLQSDSSGVTKGNLCVFDNYIATKAPSTANLARGAVVAAATLTSGKYGWFIVNGVCAVLSHDTTADNGKAYISSNAGVLTAVAVNGKQVLGANFGEAVTITGGTSTAVLTNIQHPTLQGQTS